MSIDTEDHAVVTTDARLLRRLGMRSAALFYSRRNEPYLRRFARVTRACLAETPLPEYTGTALYPSAVGNIILPDDDPDGCGLTVRVDTACLYHAEAFARTIASLTDPTEHEILQRIAADMHVYTASTVRPMRYRYGGVHWTLNFPRLLREGLHGYRARVRRHLAQAREPEQRHFYQALDELLDGLLALQARCAEYLRGSSGPAAVRLAEALARVPGEPPQSFFEALAAVRFLHFTCQHWNYEPGRLDQYLWPYYAADLAAGRVTAEEAEAWLDEFLGLVDSSVNSPGAGHMVLGGSNAEGGPAYNELTRIILRLVRKHRQPNTSLRVRPDMPDDVWETVLENLAAGSGHPALLNDPLYGDELREYAGVSREDFADMACAGCTETLVQGKTAIYATAATYNLLDILDDALAAHLPSAESFDDFYATLKDEIRLTVREMAVQCNLEQQMYAAFWHDPLRTLCTDDCIERARGFWDGGARYNFDIVNIHGIANAVNSLVTLRQVYAGKLGVSRAELLVALAADYQGYDELLGRITRLPKFGNDDPEVNALAADLLDYVFEEIRGCEYWRAGGRFLPASIMFAGFTRTGAFLGASPDGRRKGGSLSDSTGPLQGTDTHGPTAMLLSVAALPIHKGIGTCVLNLLLDPAAFATTKLRRDVRAMLQAYFTAGGGQLQVNVVDAGVLEEAMAHPERYGHLVVRVGGYNDYFVRQTEPIRKEILKRTRHTIGD